MSIRNARGVRLLVLLGALLLVGIAVARWRAPVAFELGYAYETGSFHGWSTGFQRNYGRAAYWLGEAASLGHPRAQYMLGLLYAHGWGVPKDDRDALHWFTAAADNGYVQAMFHLGWMYHKGDGVRRDRAAGMALMERAASRGMADAQFALGEFFERGEGVAQDPVQAMRWYLTALRSCRDRPEMYGNRSMLPKVEAARARLLARMSPAAIQAANDSGGSGKPTE